MRTIQSLGSACSSSSFINICFNGPLFTFLFWDIGHSRPRVCKNNLPLSLGFKHFLKKNIGDIKWKYGKKTQNIKFLKASLERLSFLKDKTNRLVAKLQEQMHQLLDLQCHRHYFLKIIGEDSVEYSKCRNYCKCR